MLIYAFSTKKWVLRGAAFYHISCLVFIQFQSNYSIPSSHLPTSK